MVFAGNCSIICCWCWCSCCCWCCCCCFLSMLFVADELAESIRDLLRYHRRDTICEIKSIAKLDGLQLWLKSRSYLGYNEWKCDREDNHSRICCPSALQEGIAKHHIENNVTKVASKWNYIEQHIAQGQEFHFYDETLIFLKMVLRKVQFLTDYEPYKTKVCSVLVIELFCYLAFCFIFHWKSIGSFVGSEFVTTRPINCN